MSATKPVFEAEKRAPSVVDGTPAPALPRATGLVRSTLHPGGRWVQTAYVLVDVVFVCLNSAAAFGIRYAPDLAQSLQVSLSSLLGEVPFRFYGGCLLLYVSMIVFSFGSQNLYRTVRGRTAFSEAVAVFKSVSLVTLLLMGFLYLTGDIAVSRLIVVFSGVMNAVTLTAWRVWKRQLVERRVAQGIGARNVVVIGGGRVGQALATYLEQNKHLGYVVKGFLDANHNGDPRMLGKIEDLAIVARQHYVDEVFITIPSERILVKQVALLARQLRLDVKVVPDLYDGLGWNAPIRFVGDYPVMELHLEPIPALGLFVKRLIDILGSAFALAALSPLMLAIGIAIRLGSAGPAIYRSRRMGKKGREFWCYKFRTMVANADALKEELRARNERNGPFFKMADDPRVTRVGRLLRKFSLDEFPQFWNVLRGDMSLVGPRPHPLDDYARYSLEDRRRLDVKPGITGLWQVTARHDPSFETNMAIDLQYIEKWTFWLDMEILLRTVPAILRGGGQ